MRWMYSLLILGWMVTLTATWGAVRVNASVMLTAVYDPGTGNISLTALDSSGSPSSLPIATIQFLSPAQYLSGAAAATPGAANSSLTFLNTDPSTIFDPPLISAEIYFTNFGSSTPLFDGFWDLGPVAAAGLSAGQISSGFTTDPDVSPGGLPLAGHFLYQVQDQAEFLSGPIMVVPEPSGMVLTAGITCAGLFLTLRRGRCRQGRDSAARSGCSR